MNKEHSLIVVPGLGGANLGLSMIVNSWKRYGINGYIYNFGWRGEGNEFKPKLLGLINQIDKLSKEGKVSLLGTSAGGSAVINAFNDRKDKIHRVINVSGRLREGDNVYPTLGVATKGSLSFKESVLLCEKVQQDFSKEDRKKILTVRSLFDETVPISTMTIDGARNDRILSVGHVLSSVLAMTVCSKKIINFLNG